MLEANKYMLEQIRQRTERAAAIDSSVAAVNDTTEQGGYPTVDLSPWFDDDSNDNQKDKQAVVDQILQHATAAGSFQVVGHGVSSELQEQLEQASRDFFALPVPEKSTWYSDDHLTGYVGIAAEGSSSLYGDDDQAKKKKKDMREVFGALEPPLNVAGPTPLQDLVEEYSRQLRLVDVVLHQLLTRALAQAKGVDLPDDFLEKARSGMRCLFRIFHYPNDAATQENETATTAEFLLKEEEVLLDAHSDWGTLTILQSRDVGLDEIGPGGSWVPVPVCDHHALHVVLGDLLHLISNGLFVNNIHRVRHLAAQRRVQHDDGTGRISFANFATQIRDPAVDTALVRPVCADKHETPLLDHALSFPEFFQGFFKILVHGDEEREAA